MDYYVSESTYRVPNSRLAIDSTEHCLEISAVTAAAVANPVKSSDRTLRVH